MGIARALKTACLGVLGGLIVGPLTSCTTTSQLSSLADSNIEAVNRISSENEAQARTAQSTDTAGQARSGPESSDAIVGAPRRDEPARPDPVARKKPTPQQPPATLASVPLTSVESRPANQIMMVRTTAYSHLQADSLQYGRKSAAGTDLKYGSRVRSAAADWSIYPLGTRFKIEGLPYEYVVDDYGSALVGTETIDIYKPQLSGISDWGVRNVPIRVLEWGSFEESRRILDSRKHVRHADHVREMLRDIENKGRNGYLTGGGGSA